MSGASPRRRRRLSHAFALCAACVVARAAARSTDPRAGPLQLNVPSTAPRVVRHSRQPYVVAVTTVNGDSYVSGGVGAYSYTNRCALPPGAAIDSAQLLAFDARLGAQHEHVDAVRVR
jgi:hypothetical protein